MERKKLQIWLPLLLSLAMIFGMYLGYRMRDSTPGKSFFFTEKSTPIQELLDLLDAKYVDEINTSQLADTAIAAIFSKLDPHSQFIPATSVEQSKEDIAGAFYGIGIEFDIFDDTLHVINVMKDGPSHKAGLKTGDKFLKAGDSVIAGRKKTSAEIREILKGNRGSKIDVILLRAGKPVTVTLERDFIPVSSIDAAYMMDKTIGYIRLNKFTQQTYREFMQSLEKLKGAGMTKLILDLRGNGGGVLDEAVELADEFLEGDKLITYTEGRHFPRKEYRSRRQGQFETGELVVLGDEGSASASEVLMGALQDWDRATIIGRTTFGKGLVQEQFDLSDRSAVRLTVSRYFTPLGRSIQRSYAAGINAYYDDIAKRFIPADSGKVDSALAVAGKKFKTRSGKVVYEGGGITPDHFINADTARFGNSVARLYAKGVMTDFGYRYAVENSASFNKFKTPETFAANFQIDENAWKYFSTLAQKDSIDVSTLRPSERDFIQKGLRLAVARQLWRHQGFYTVFNKEDEAVQKAIQLLTK